MAEQKQLTWIADANGLVVRSDQLPQPRRALSREERVDAYRAGIKRVAGILRDLGFQTHYECEHSVSMHYAGVLLDFRVQRPENVAYVTSWTVGAQGRKAKHGGCIYRLADEIKSEFAIQIVVGKEASGPPVYVALDESLEDPEAHIIKSIMGFLASLRERGDRLGVALKQKQLPYRPEQLPDWV